MTRPALLALALALALVACGGGGDDAPPWRLTIEAKCAAPAACPTFPLWDGTARPTATPPPLTEAEAVATMQAPAAMTAAADGMAARATEGARP